MDFDVDEVINAEAAEKILAEVAGKDRERDHARCGF
jgi:hypothetical protein